MRAEATTPVSVPARQVRLGNKKVRFVVKKRTVVGVGSDHARSDPSPSAIPPEGAFWDQEGASLGSRSDSARQVHLGIKTGASYG